MNLTFRRRLYRESRTMWKIFSGQTEEEGEILFQFRGMTCGILLLVLGSAIPAATCFAGAWTMPAGTYYARMAFNAYDADERFDLHGDRAEFPNNGDFYDVNVTGYLEYGLRPNLTLIGNLVYKYLSLDDDSIESETYGFGDIEAAVRYLIADTPGGVFSIQGLVKIPEAYDETDDVPLGNGQYDLEIRLLYGRSLYPMLPGYIGMETGYRFRIDEPADEWRYLLEIGGDFTEKWYGRVKLDGILGIGNAAHESDGFGNPAATEEYDLGKLDICMGFRLSKRFAVEVGAIPALYGENTSAGTTWSVALVLQ